MNLDFNQAPMQQQTHVPHLQPWGKIYGAPEKTDRQAIISRLDLPSLIQELIPTAKKSGREYSGLCPFHDDHAPSLSVNPETGAFFCFSCDKRGGIIDLYGKVKGLSLADTFMELERRAGIGGSIKPTAKQKEVDRHNYHDANGNLLYQRVRIEPGDEGRSKKYKPWDPATRQWQRPCAPVLYHLPDVIGAQEVIICEGERKADVVKSWGLVGTCFDSGANSSITPAMIEALTGKHIAILPDNDLPGRKYRDNIIKAMTGKAASIRVVDLPGLAVKGDIVDWIKTPGNDKARLLELIQSTPEWCSSDKQGATEIDNSSEGIVEEGIEPFDLSRLKTGAEIYAGDYSVNWIWDKMFPEGAIILLYAQGGSGKSTLMSQAADAISKGLPFMGLQTSRRPVVIVDYENPLGVLKSRMGAVNDQTSVMYWTLTDEPPQLDKEWKSLVSLVATLGNPLLIFDTLQSATSDLDITSNKDYSPVMRKLKQLREMGATIVLLHHTPKSDATKYVGASVIYNQVDHVIAQYPVKQAGTDKEAIEDDDTASVYRFGSKDKTRYGHHKIYVMFDEEKKIFVESEGPDQEAITILKNVIIELAPVNQTVLLANNTVEGLISKSMAKRILKKYSGVYWNAEKGDKNATIYTPISCFSVFHPYIGPENWQTEISGGIHDEKQATTGTPENQTGTEFDSLPEWAK